MKRIALSFALLSILSFGCKVQDQNNQEVLLVLERTPCFGNCPIFELTVFSNGKAILKAGEFMPMDKGDYELELSKSAVKDLRESLDELKFDEFEDQYGREIPDIPSVRIKHKDKTIVIWEAAPAQLQELIHKIESLTRRDGWERRSSTIH